MDLPVTRPLFVAGLLLALALPKGAAGFDARLESTGPDGLQTALSAASLVLAAKRDGTETPNDILAAARADYRQLLGALYRAGYYGGTIRIAVDGREVASLPPFYDPASIGEVVLRVGPGPRFTFGTAEVSPLPEGAALPEGFAPGAPARSSVIGEAAQAGIDAWRATGRAKAQVSGQSIIADHPSATLNAQLRLAPGPVLRFGDLAVDGAKRMRPERIVEIAGLPTGKRFSPAALDDAATRLRRAGVFRSVALREDETAGADDTLGITATVVEQKPRRYRFGAEASSLDGMTFSAMWLHRNLFGGAERLQLDGEVAGIGTGALDYSATARLTRPATFHPDVALFATGEIAHLEEPDFTSDSVEVGLGLSTILGRRLSAEMGVAYRFSDVTDGFGSRQFRHVLLPIEAAYERRDDALDPTRGSYIALGATPFFGLSGSASGAQLRADLRGYVPLDDEGRRIIAGRFQLGSVMGSTIGATPPNFLFYSGGGGSVRGHPYQSLDVDLGGGLRAGGLGFVGLSGELRAMVKDDWQVVGFADAGFVGASAVPGKDGAWHAGAGLGLRYHTGFGPIRLDLAAPVAGDTGDGLQIYVGIGQAF